MELLVYICELSALVEKKNTTTTMDDKAEATPVEEIKFEELVTKLNLSRKVTQTLRTEELVAKDTIILLEERDLKEIGLPIGAVKLILLEIAGCKRNGKSETVKN